MASWTDKKGGTFTMAITQAREITAGRNEDLAENFQLKIDDNQRYVYLHIEVNNNTGEEIELYNKRYSIDWFERNYTDEVIRDHFYESEEDADVRTTYPNANKMVDAPAVLWAYNNGLYLNGRGNFGVVCYTGTAGKPREAQTWADIPEGASYLDCIGQITENLQTFRLVYRLAGQEVNFVLYPSQFA